MVVEGVFDAILQSVGTSFKPGITESLMLGSPSKNDGVSGALLARADYGICEFGPGVSEFAFCVKFLAYGGRVQFELDGVEVFFQDIQKLLLLVQELGPLVVATMFAYQRTFATRSSV